MDEKMTSVRPFRVEALHTLALFALAIAQPVFSTIGEAPEFLVAHNATPLVIVAFAVGLALIAPLAIIAVEWLVSRIYRPAGKVLHGLVVLVLLGIIAQQVLDRFLDLDVKLLLGLSLLLAVLASLLYWRSATVSRMVSIAAIGALLLPLNFLFVSPASRLVLSKGGDVFGEVSPPKKTPPIVFIVFDEFNPTALLDENKQIDEVRYPNFAALAKESWWFTKATSPYYKTTVAVPAILTGKRPEQVDLLPMYADHPRNLFTMLGGTYRLNVHELLTSLCPANLCTDNKKDFSSRRFAFDLLVILGYAILPQEVAEAKLPGLQGGWNGFGARQETTRVAASNDIKKAAGKKLGANPRSYFVDNFIASSGAESAQLDFLHVVLPHGPYEFFPSGRLYNSSRYALGGDMVSWGDNQDLINLDYYRYLLQLGMVDRKLGELIGRLKEKGVYDDALIIVTADHGRTFSRNRFLREMSQENAELLHVPLFIKRPGQTKGEVSEAHASTLDILPTIAAELGIETSWNLDGVPLFSSEVPGRERVTLKNHKGEIFDFPWDEIVRLPLLDWQTKTFAPRQPLDELKIEGPYADLIGDLASLQADVSSEAPSARMLQNLQTLTIADPEAGYIPALIDSEITGDVPVGTWVLMTLNDRVAAVTQVYERDQGKFVSALLPEKLFRARFNKFEAFLFFDEAGTRRLIPIQTETTSYQLSADGGAVISSHGTVYPISTQKRFGHVDILRADEGSIRVSGWSVDRAANKPVEAVAIFSGKDFICATNPAGERPDVATYLKAPDATLSGFSIVCPFRGRDADLTKLKVYGIAPSGEAGELHIPPPPA